MAVYLSSMLPPLVLDSNMTLSFDDLSLKCVVNGDQLSILIPLTTDTVVRILSDKENKGLKYKVASKKISNINGVLHLGKYKTLAIDHLPQFVDTNYVVRRFLINKDVKGIGYFFAPRSESNLFENKPSSLFLLEKEYLVFFMDSDFLIRFPYTLSKDRKTLQVNLKRKSAISPIGYMLNDATDSLSSLFHYNGFLYDDNLKSADVQENKEDFLRIVNREFRINQHTSPDSFDIIRGTVALYERLALKYSYDLLFNTDDNEIALAALNVFLDERYAAETRNIVENIKPLCVQAMLNNYILGKEDIIVDASDSPNFDQDSISFALGYANGVLLANSLSEGVDEFELIEGLQIGYRLALSGVDSPEVWSQVLTFIQTRPEAFKLGIKTGIQGVKQLCDWAYIAGSFYGCTGKPQGWSPKEMKLYLEKFSKVDSDVKQPIKIIRVPDNVKSVLGE